MSKSYDATTAATLDLSNYVLASALSGDTVALSNYTSGSYDNANAGSGKNITVSGLGLLGPSANNYALSATSLTASIGTIHTTGIAVTADNITREYGIANPTLTYTYIGLAPGDADPIFSGALATVADSNANAGTYSITQGTLTSSNYTFSFFGGTLTVTPVSLTIQANNASRFANQANPVFTATFSGFRNNDNESLITGLNYSSTAIANAPAGVYTITPYGANPLTNYTFNYVNGQITVGLANLPSAVEAAIDQRNNIINKPAQTIYADGISTPLALGINAEVQTGTGHFYMEPALLEKLGIRKRAKLTGGDITIQEAR